MRYIPKGQARRMLDELLAMRTRPKENGPVATPEVSERDQQRQNLIQ